MTDNLKPRPLINLHWPQLAELVDKRYNDLIGLTEVLYELGFRSRAGAMRARERIIQRLNELSKNSFAWPTTATLKGDGYLDADDWPQKGILSFLGYHVGDNGLNDTSRREILDLAYNGVLPNVNDQAYMDQWGNPASARRLRKMANSIASFCRGKKSRDPDLLAVKEWDSDLEYLRLKYYVGRYDFDWPNTSLA